MGVNLMNAHRTPPDAIQKARTLRSNMTDVERVVWQAIRGAQMDGYKFRRQFAIGKYIADFACIEKKLVIELDGGQHQYHQDYDEQRSAFIQEQGWQVLRFWNNDVLENLDGVLHRISEKLKDSPPP